MLDYAKHINITEDYYAPGSLGNFNLQFNVDVQSNNRLPNPGQMDLVIITVNSGVFVTEKGQSATYTGVLTKDDVLSAASQRPESDADARRVVGGAINFGSLAGLAKKVVGTAQKFAPVVGAVSSMLPKTGALGKVGSVLSKGSDFVSKLPNMGDGRPSGGMHGRGRGSSAFNIEDRLY